MPNLNKFGEDADVSGGDVVLVASTQIADQAGANAKIYDFSATAETGTANTFVELQLSNDGAAWTTVARIFVATPGMIQKTYAEPVEVRRAQFFRVVGSGDNAGVVSGELSGQCSPADIVDV